MTIETIRMNNEEQELLAAANRTVELLLLGASVESFGLMHQVPFIEFRNSEGQDVTLSFDSKTTFSATFPSFLNEDEQLLLGMNSMNLKQVETAFCTEKADLEVRFNDGTWFRVDGIGKDGYDPWQLSEQLRVDAGGTMLIAFAGGGFAIWGNGK